MVLVCYNRYMKDCKIIFKNGQQDYEFKSEDLQKALEWVKNKPVQCIKTPWGVLQVYSDDEYDKIMSVFE